MRSPLTAVGLVAALAGAFAVAQVPPLSRQLLRLRPAGAGPTVAQREKGWFRARFVAASGDQRIVTEVSGGDPGHGETAKMLAESALCPANDDLPETAGQVTSAVAMGGALRVRLERAGIRFRVIN